MNKEQQAQFAACVFRSAFLLKMLDYEMNYYSKFPAPSGIKNEFNRMAKCYKSGLTNISLYMPQTKDVFKAVLNENEERILSMSAIVEKLALLPLEYVQQVEKDLEEIKIEYK